MVYTTKREARAKLLLREDKIKQLHIAQEYIELKQCSIMDVMRAIESEELMCPLVTLDMLKKSFSPAWKAARTTGRDNRTILTPLLRTGNLRFSSVGQLMLSSHLIGHNNEQRL
jgi:hypothetical protein